MGRILELDEMTIDLEEISCINNNGKIFFKGAQSTIIELKNIEKVKNALKEYMDSNAQKTGVSVPNVKIGDWVVNSASGIRTLVSEFDAYGKTSITSALNNPSRFKRWKPKIGELVVVSDVSVAVWHVGKFGSKMTNTLNFTYDDWEDVSPIESLKFIDGVLSE